MILSVMLACGTQWGGSAVGNPGNAGFTSVDVPRGVELDVARLEVKAFGLDGPGTRTSSMSVPKTAWRTCWLS